MIKVNLLEGAADTRAATRATKAATKTTKQVLLIAGALVALLVALGVDYFVASARLKRADRELAAQQEAAADLKKNKEQLETLQKQIKSVEERIKIIDDLQKTQKGPSAMLNLINSKMPANGLLLERIAQVKEQLTIDGVADDPNVVSEFARGLELGSNGLFQSVGLNVSRNDETVPDAEDPSVKTIVTKYKFTITTRYTPTLVGQPQQPQQGAAAPGGAPAATPAAAPAGK
jgi:Tfp pilus assembly protein PilN